MIFYRLAEGQYGYVREETDLPAGATIIEQAEYPGPYWFTTPNSYGWASDRGSVPGDMTELITLVEYNVLVAQTLADELAAAQAELEAAYQRFRDAYASYRQLGLPQANALLLAAQIGTEPPGFDPTWPPLP